MTLEMFKQFSLVNWYAIVRDRQKFIYTLIFPFIFISIFFLLEVLGSQQDLDVVIDDGVGTAEQALEAHEQVTVVDLAVDPEQLSGIDIAVEAPEGLDGEIFVVTSGGIGPGSIIEGILVDAGASPDAVNVFGPDGEPPFEPLRFGIPAVLVLAFASLALFGTAVPIMQLRERGSLRLLGVTPLPRVTFLLAQAPARLGIALIQLFVMASLAAATGFLEINEIAGLLTTLALGLAMLFSLGYLAAGLLHNSETASLVLGSILPVLLFPSGIFLPLDLFPEIVQETARFIPLTYLGDALRQDLVGFEGEFSRWLSYAVMGGTAVAVTALASKTFKWDQGE